jgi:hypothetical protein
VQMATASRMRRNLRRRNCNKRIEEPGFISDFLGGNSGMAGSIVLFSPI